MAAHTRLAGILRSVLTSSSIKGPQKAHLRILHPANSRLPHTLHTPTTMSKLPTTQKGLFIETPKGAWVVQEHEVHTPEADELLVRVEAVGLNPADWKVHDFGVLVEKYPGIIGFDGAGVVVALGSGVDKNAFKIGDRVYVTRCSIS